MISILKILFRKEKKGKNSGKQTTIMMKYDVRRSRSTINNT